METKRVQRRLAAILAADVVAYARLMEVDEAGTLAALKERRRDVLEPLVGKHQGRIFKVAGDGVLVEFGSAVNALYCANELQKGMEAANRNLPEDRHVILRIGINLGDVMVEGGDLYGEGVNIAARLEAIAAPGAIVISGATQEHVKNKVKLAFEDLGLQTLKNIAEPVRAYRVAGVASSRQANAAISTEKPAIALLPFANLSGDPAQDYLGDGLTENVIAALSRFRDFTVISSNSTFVYKGKATKIQDVARELGVHYVLEGSVQRSGDHIRITAQLIEGATGRHLWSERYDRPADDIFAVQDEVTEMIVGTLAAGYGGRLRKAWRRRSEASGPESYRAFDYFQRGMDQFNRFTARDVEQARELFRKAIELDPAYAKPHAKIGWTHLSAVLFGWSKDPSHSLKLALESGTEAIARDDEEGWGHWALAGYYTLRGDHERAIGEYTKALDLNPNDADVLNDFGQCLSYAGRANEAIETVRRAMRLNPHYPEYWPMQLGPMLFDARRYEEAISTLTSLRLVNTVNVQLYLAASLAALGRMVEARKAVAQALELDSGASLEKCTSREMAPYKRPEDLEHFRENLAKAGLV